MEIKNCTPWPVKLTNGPEFEPCGIVPHAVMKYGEWDESMGIPVTSLEFGKAVGLPPKQEGVLLIVSSMVAESMPERDDLIIPAKAHPSAVKKDGKVVSVPGFVRARRWPK